MKPADAITEYDKHCADCKQYENKEARSMVCPFCVIEIGRNQSILEDQIQMNGGMQNV